MSIPEAIGLSFYIYVYIFMHIVVYSCFLYICCLYSQITSHPSQITTTKTRAEVTKMQCTSTCHFYVGRSRVQLTGPKATSMLQKVWRHTTWKKVNGTARSHSYIHGNGTIVMKPAGTSDTSGSVGVDATKNLCSLPAGISHSSISPFFGLA